MPPAKTTRASQKKGNALKAKAKTARDLKTRASKAPAKKATAKTNPVAARSKERQTRNSKRNDGDVQIIKLEKSTNCTSSTNARPTRKKPAASRPAAIKTSNRAAKITTKTAGKATKPAPKKPTNSIIKKTTAKKPTKTQQDRARKAQEKSEREEYQKSLDAIEIMRQAVTVEAKNTNNKISMLTERDVREIIRYASHNSPTPLPTPPQVEHKLGLLEAVKVKIKKVIHDSRFPEVANQQDLEADIKPRSWFFW